MRNAVWTPGESPGPRHARSIRAIPARRTGRDPTTSRAVDGAFGMPGVRDAPARRTQAQPSRSGIYPASVRLAREAGRGSAVARYRETRQRVEHRRIRSGPADRRPRRWIVVRREFKARTNQIERFQANSVSPQAQALTARAPGTGDEAVGRRRRAPGTPAPSRVSPVVQAFDAGALSRERGARRKFAVRPRRRPRTGLFLFDRRG